MGKRQKAKGVSWKLEVGKINRYAIAFIFFLSSIFFNKATAQCAMCRASLESSGQEKQAEALNDGIVYLMVIPYVLVAVAGFFIYRMYTKKKN
jgi:hypothetical protein